MQRELFCDIIREVEHERITESSAYLNFLSRLSVRGETTKMVVEKVLEMVQDGRIRIEPNSSSTFSVVSLGDGNSRTIFLPQDYDEERALSELPRVLTEALRVSSGISQSHLDQIGKKFGKELGLTE